MSFMDAAPSIFACFDQPDLKAPFTFHVTAPLDWTVIGNAPGTQVERGPSSALWEFEPLTASINALVESERENLDHQRNTMSDLAHSLKTPLAVLRTRLDNDASEAELREEVDIQLRRKIGRAHV